MEEFKSDKLKIERYETENSENWFLTYRDKQTSTYLNIGKYSQKRFLYYEILDEKRIALYEARKGIPSIIDINYFDGIKDFLLEIVGEDIKERKEVTKHKLIVGDLLRACKLDYITLGYGSSRTIAKSHLQKAIAYNKSYFGLIVTFRNKKKKLQTFILTKSPHWYGNCKGRSLDHKDAIEIYEEIRKNKLGAVVFSKKTKQEMIDEMIVESI